VLNGGSNGHYVTVTVAETTIYANGWDTFSGLNTQLIFQNTTSQNINYTLTLTATNGGPQTGTTSGTLGPVSSATEHVQLTASGPAPGGLGMNTSEYGNGIFAHDGPPGAVQPRAWWFNYSVTPFTIVPMPIGPLRGK
jgi:hypothetical protein